MLLSTKLAFHVNYAIIIYAVWLRLADVLMKVVKFLFCIVIYLFCSGCQYNNILIPKDKNAGIPLYFSSLLSIGVVILVLVTV
jgi:hypothetical protein